MEVAHSNAVSHMAIGTLTGSVKAMATSKDFKEAMKKNIPFILKCMDGNTKD